MIKGLLKDLTHRFWLGFWLLLRNRNNRLTLKRIIKLADSIDRQIVVWKRTRKNEPLHIWTKWKILTYYSFVEMENLYFESLNVDIQLSQLLLTGMLCKCRKIEDLIFIVDQMEETNEDYDVASRWLIEGIKNEENIPQLLYNVFSDEDSDYPDFFRKNPMALGSKEFWIAVSKTILNDSKYGRLAKKALLYYGMGS